MKYDVETFEADLLALVKSKLPAKLAEITTEKADGITLAVPTDSEYFNSTDDDVDNRKMAVLYGVIDGNTVSISSNVAEDDRYLFLVYLNEMNALPGVTRKKLLRYQRALKEVITENFRKFPCISTMEIQSISPTETGWGINENSPVYKVSGIYIQASIAG